MKIPMPVALLAGGASKRMGRPKAQLPFGAGTLLQHQLARLAPLFEDIFLVVKDPPDAATGRARVLLDATPRQAPIYGLMRALEEVTDHVFVLAIDLPLIAPDLVRAIAERGLSTGAPALIPEAKGRLEPLAAVWRHAILPVARQQVAAGDLSLQGLARAAGAEIFPESEWRQFDPSGNSWANMNTMADYLALRERA
jgi:molybdopterin-guanine dinucleotide biosynthesis protein A